MTSPDWWQYRCRDHFFPPVKIFPAIHRVVIFDVDFVINVVRTVTAWIVSAVYTHTHNSVHAYLCLDQRHFFRCSAIMAPGGYSQSCDFRRGFCDKWLSGRSLRESYISAVYTHIHIHRITCIFVRRSAINITFCE